MCKFFCDKKFLIGVGIGLILASSLMAISKKSVQYKDSIIEQKARDLGMIYPDEVTAIPKDKEANKK